MAKLAVLAIHGIGKTKTGYSRKLQANLRQAVGSAVSDKVYFGEIDYQTDLQGNQEKLWERVKGGLRWLFLRRFLLFYFGDAAAVLYNSRELDSVYLKTQKSIRDAAAIALQHLDGPDCPVVIVAQSLGCQIISSYIWDAQHESGIWAPRHAAELGAEPGIRNEFLKLYTTRYFLTTGCNIPLIVSGLVKVLPFDQTNERFRWLNFYDQDDPLGWPLESLYSYESTSARPEDIVVNVGSLLTSWNPLSHGAYWTSPSFIQPASKLVSELLSSYRS